MAYINNEKHYVYRGGGIKEDHFIIVFKETEVTVEIPVSLFDELTVMRYAQLAENRTLQKIQKRAYKKHVGTLSCEPLARVLGKPTALSDIGDKLKGGIKKE